MTTTMGEIKLNLFRHNNRSRGVKRRGGKAGGGGGGALVASSNRDNRNENATRKHGKRTKFETERQAGGMKEKRASMNETGKPLAKDLRGKDFSPKEKKTPMKTAHVGDMKNNSNKSSTNLLESMFLSSLGAAGDHKKQTSSKTTHRKPMIDHKKRTSTSKSEDNSRTKWKKQATNSSSSASVSSAEAALLAKKKKKRESDRKNFRRKQRLKKKEMMNQERDPDEDLVKRHPSWIAKREMRNRMRKAKFEGAHIRYPDDDDDGDGNDDSNTSEVAATSQLAVEPIDPSLSLEPSFISETSSTLLIDATPPTTSPSLPIVTITKPKRLPTPAPTPTQTIDSTPTVKHRSWWKQDLSLTDEQQTKPSVVIAPMTRKPKPPSLPKLTTKPTKTTKTTTTTIKRQDERPKQRLPQQHKLRTDEIVEDDKTSDRQKKLEEARRVMKLLLAKKLAQKQR